MATISKRVTKTAAPAPQAPTVSPALLSQFRAHCDAIRSRYFPGIMALSSQRPPQIGDFPSLETFLADAALIYVAAHAGWRMAEYDGGGNLAIIMERRIGRDATFAVYGDLVAAAERLAMLELFVGCGIRKFVVDTVPEDARYGLINDLRRAEGDIVTGG